jgi:hypothetical protein
MDKVPIWHENIEVALDNNATREVIKKEVFKLSHTRMI